MPWVARRLRGTKIYVQCDDSGEPVKGPDDRVEMFYKPGGKRYRAALRNLEVDDDRSLLSDDQAATAEPAPSPRAARSASHTPHAPHASHADAHAQDHDHGHVHDHDHDHGAAGAAKAKEPPVHVYTDGACTGNPGPMGLGVVIVDPLEKGDKARRERSEYLGRGTNNIAELTAIARGLDGLSRERPVVVYTDSAYSIGILAQGFKAKKNLELVAELRALCSQFRHLEFKKVRGHSGHPENERCDELARAAITRGR